jgi:hypothetical protein
MGLDWVVFFFHLVFFEDLMEGLAWHSLQH